VVGSVLVKRFSRKQAVAPSYVISTLYATHNLRIARNYDLPM
jgi:hypothetical protein